MNPANKLELKGYIHSFFITFSYLILTKNKWIGVFLFAFTCFYPSRVVLAVISFAITVLASRVLGIHHNKLVEDLVTYNSLLVGLLLGYLYEISFLIVLVTVIISIFSLLISYALWHLFSHYLKLPILNLPYSLIAILLYLAFIRYSNLLVLQQTNVAFLNLPDLPLVISSFLKALGLLIFMPYDVAGLLVLVTIFIFSKINFFLVCSGYYFGTGLLWLLKGSVSLSFNNPYSFNFILIALALGGFFLIPSIKSYIIAIVSVLLSTFLLDAIAVLGASFGLPVFTLPFVCITSLSLYVLNLSGYPYRTKVFLDNPEENLEHYLTYAKRFEERPAFGLPFNGEWKVYQAFDDKWTHQGSWRHAVDFVIENKPPQEPLEMKAWRCKIISVLRSQCWLRSPPKSLAFTTTVWIMKLAK